MLNSQLDFGKAVLFRFLLIGIIQQLSSEVFSPKTKIDYLKISLKLSVFIQAPNCSPPPFPHQLACISCLFQTPIELSVANIKKNLLNSA